MVRPYRYKGEVCGRGHPWTPESTHIRKNGQRLCKICANARTLAYLNARYRNDPEFRERVKQRSRDHYYRNHANASI